MTLAEAFAALPPALHTPILRIEDASGACRFAAARAPAMPEGAFHTASVTKTMTATVVLQLAEEGAFSLDAPFDDLGVIDRALTRGRLDGGITLRHLLSHTAGIRDTMEDDAETLGGPAPGSVIGGLMRDPAKAWVPWDPALPEDPAAGVINHFFASGTADARLAQPGARFHYSDTGFMLLALLIEHAGGEPLHTAFRRRLFDPHGIADIWLAYREPPRLPETDQYFGDLPLLASGVSLSFDWGGGGLVSTAAALAAFLRTLLSGGYFRKAETLAAMQDWQAPEGLALPRTGVGLGLFRTERDGLTLIGHSGAPGAKMFTDPASGMILTGTANQAVGGGDWHWPLAALARKEFA